MLKRFLATLDGLSDEIKAFYKASGDGFVLQVDGKDAEDVTALKNAKDHEKNLRAAAENKVKELTGQVETLTASVETITGERDAAVADKGQDVQALEASWKEKLRVAEAARDETAASLTGEIERLLRTNTSTLMAAEISTVPELFSEVIARRLKVEKGADGQYFTRVLDAAGAPSALTLDELKQELLANEKYAAIVISGKGSGGGAGGPGSGGGSTEKKWLDHTDEELIALRQSDPDKYERLKAAHKAGATT